MNINRAKRTWTAQEALKAVIGNENAEEKCDIEPRRFYSITQAKQKEATACTKIRVSEQIPEKNQLTQETQFQMVSEVKRQIANSFHKQTSAQTTLKKPLQQLQIVNVGTCRQNDLQPTKKKSNASAPAVSNLNKTLQGFTKSIGEVQLQMDNKSSKHIGHSVQVKRRLDFPEQLMNAEHCQKTCVEKSINSVSKTNEIVLPNNHSMSSTSSENSVTSFNNNANEDLVTASRNECNNLAVSNALLFAQPINNTTLIYDISAGTGFRDLAANYSYHQYNASDLKSASGFQQHDFNNVLFYNTSSENFFDKNQAVYMPPVSKQQYDYNGNQIGAVNCTYAQNYQQTSNYFANGIHAQNYNQTNDFYATYGVTMLNTNMYENFYSGNNIVHANSYNTSTDDHNTASYRNLATDYHPAYSQPTFSSFEQTGANGTNKTYVAENNVMPVIIEDVHNDTFNTNMLASDIRIAMDTDSYQPWSTPWSTGTDNFQATANEHLLDSRLNNNTENATNFLTDGGISGVNSMFLQPTTDTAPNIPSCHIVQPIPTTLSALKIIDTEVAVETTMTSSLINMVTAVNIPSDPVQLTLAISPQTTNNETVTETVVVSAPMHINTAFDILPDPPEQPQPTTLSQTITDTENGNKTTVKVPMEIAVDVPSGFCVQPITATLSQIAIGTENIMRTTVTSPMEIAVDIPPGHEVQPVSDTLLQATIIDIENVVETILTSSPMHMENAINLQPETVVEPIPPIIPMLITNESNHATESIISQSKRGKKRRRQQDSWQAKIRSKLYNEGKEWHYKKQRKERKPTWLCREKCRLKCRENFSAEEQNILHISFWNLGMQLRRRDFIISHTKRSDVVRKSKGRKSQSVTYTLPKNEVDVAVCKSFFVNTLAISDHAIYYNLSHAEMRMARRSTKRPSNRKLPKEKHDFVCEHINMFPKVDSHYCRQSSEKQYLDSNLNISEMYRLYVSKCNEMQIQPVQESMYRYIFQNEFNLGFHVPKKDACDSCTAYNVMVTAGTITEAKQAEHDAHMRRKDQARKEKEVDKIANPEEKVVAAFDLEQVLTCPRLTVGSAYYMRKLNVYNLTIWEMQSHQGYCYIWNESEANRGSNEIATCVWKWLLEKDHQGVKNIVLYSDTCGGQNRNRLMCTSFACFLNMATNIVSIEQKFFESGHSQCECDNMHSCIERRLRNRTIYLPSQFYQLMKRTSHVKPYYVYELSHSDIMNFESVNVQCMKATAFNGIQTIHHIMYTKHEGSIKISFSEEIGGNLKERSYLRKNAQLLNMIPLAYNDRRKIDLQKKNDLLRLCKFLPPDSSAFYQDLPVSAENPQDNSDVTNVPSDSIIINAAAASTPAEQEIIDTTVTQAKRSRSTRKSLASNRDLEIEDGPSTSGTVRTANSTSELEIPNTPVISHHKKGTRSTQKSIAQVSDHNIVATVVRPSTSSTITHHDIAISAANNIPERELLNTPLVCHQNLKKKCKSTIRKERDSFEK